ncbi:DNA polymerase IV [Niveibacterium sp. SC-1]|uniref:DNA polymerase IV n=1 Tax=Niveibacterium sp. SC-1 TaxID=3135646 RepID=UPI00311F0405
MTALRRIAHLDMDAFYASVELLSRPELRGQPVVVGGRRAVSGERPLERLSGYVGRGVATTATYEARALGVHSGIGLMKAAQLAPDAWLLPADFEAYRHYSRLFKAAVREIAPKLEDRGIDEIYLDLTDIPVETRALASQLKQAVRDATGLSCSIGVAPNKLLAKICSDLEKPDGLTVISEADLAPRIWPLPAKKINGIGPKANEKLEGLGIRSIGELAAADPQWLIGHFGRSYGAWLHEASHGRDEREVVTESEPKSISRETTFERDLHAKHDRETLSRIFTDLCERVAGDLQRKGYAGRSIGIKLRFEDFRTVTRDHSLPVPTQDAKVIRKAAGECLKRVPLEKRLRLLGVRIGNLVPVAELAQGAAEPYTPYSLPLFGD